MQFWDPEYKKDINIMERAEGHQKGQRAGAHDIGGEGERRGSAQPSAEKAKGRPCCHLQLPNERVWGRWIQTLHVSKSTVVRQDTSGTYWNTENSD